MRSQLTMWILPGERPVPSFRCGQYGYCPSHVSSGISWGLVLGPFVTGGSSMGHSPGWSSPCPLVSDRPSRDGARARRAAGGRGARRRGHAARPGRPAVLHGPARSPSRRSALAASSSTPSSWSPSACGWRPNRDIGTKVTIGPYGAGEAWVRHRGGRSSASARAAQPRRLEHGVVDFGADGVRRRIEDLWWR